MKTKKRKQNNAGKDLSALDSHKTKPNLTVNVNKINGTTQISINDKGDALVNATGTISEDLAKSLITQLYQALPTTMRQDELSLNAAVALLQGIAPRDELEGALATQMVAIHHASTEMIRRAMLNEQLAEGVTANINRAVKLSRTFTAQIEALQKYRSKGQQTIKVQHVQVNEGGKAIVGNVKTGGGDNG